MKTPVTYPLKNTAPPGVKYYMYAWDNYCFYYAVHKDGRVQMTSSNGGWIATNAVDPDATRCPRRVAVDRHGNHETWD